MTSNKKMVFKTVLEESRAEMIEKKSRFIASVKPVSTEAEALDFINARKAEFRDATHNVYAYVISENNICRYSDDGEPGGTAGVPTLDVINKEGLTDVVVVVTRYFGGTLLGAGGLVRAYGKSAKLGILASKITEKVYCHKISIDISYDWLGKIRYIIENGDYILGDIEYADKVTVTAFVKYDLLDRFLKEIEEATNAQVAPTVCGELYIDRLVEAHE